MFRIIDAHASHSLRAACGTSVHAQGVDGRLKKIADHDRRVNIAYRTDAVPFSFVNDSKQVAGFSIDLCKRVVNSIERQLNVQSLKVNWSASPWIRGVQKLSASTFVRTLIPGFLS